MLGEVCEGHATSFICDASESLIVCGTLFDQRELSQCVIFFPSSVICTGRSRGFKFQGCDFFRLRASSPRIALPVSGNYRRCVEKKEKKFPSNQRCNSVAQGWETYLLSRPA